MSAELPVIFWIHSPIAFESFLAFQKTYNAGPVFPCTARNIHISESIFELGYPGLYQHQTAEEIDASARSILKGMQHVLCKHEAYVLALPQSAQPYIEALIESPQCRGYVYYDEGSACYEPNFQSKQMASYHRYQMKRNAGFESLTEFLQVDKEKIYTRHRQGVPFYDFRHKKYLGCFSFFETAFPGCDSTLLPMPELSLNINEICRNYNIILASDFLNGLRSPDECRVHLNNINILMKKFNNIIIKSHPSDLESEVRCKVDVGAVMWSDFCNENNINVNSEVSFLDFKLYISRGNSTSVYMKNMEKFNILSIL